MIKVIHYTPVDYDCSEDLIMESLIHQIQEYKQKQNKIAAEKKEFE